MNFFSLAIRTNSLNYTIPAGIFSTARAVIIAYAELKLIPAFLAQTFIGITDAFAATDAGRGPKKMIQTLQDK